MSPTAGGAPVVAANIASISVPAADERNQAISCMTSAIVYEAEFEPLQGQEAVAEVILNRLRNPTFPKSICGVVFQGSERRTGCQFSFTCDGSMRKLLPADAIARAREVAERAIDGMLVPQTAGATHYHADYVSPYWAPSLIRVGAIGRHIFYRQPGATAQSAVARYLPTSEQMPAQLVREEGKSIASPSDVARAERPVERFMPWGLAPALHGAGKE